MSFTPTRQPIDPFKLLGDTFSQIAPIYVSLLILVSPGILVSIVQQILPLNLQSAVLIVYSLTIAPIIAGAAMYFTYRYLKQGTIDLSGSINKALSRGGQLILGTIIYNLAVFLGFVCFIIPGIYLSVRWVFVIYAIILQDHSAIDGLKYSSELVKGRWWQVFGSMLVSIVFLVPLFVIAAVAGIALKSQPALAGIFGGVVGALFAPLLVMYYVKLYLRLQETANLEPQS
jgi:Membrane domain of glycerophosphoryl diester phosphodiesterase